MRKRVQVVIAVLVCAFLIPPVGADARSGLDDPVFPTLGSADFDALHYGIDLRWFTSGSIDATATMTARARKGLTQLQLDLVPRLTVSAVRVDDVGATFGRSGNKLVITVPTPVASGSTFTVEVAYGGSPRHLVEADGSKDGWIRTFVGAVVLGEPRGSMTWFPNNNTPSDKATYDVAIEVPSGMTAVSNGRNESAVTALGRTTWRWRVAEPMASFLVTVAIGNYRRYQETVDGIRYDSFVSNTVRSNAKPVRLLPQVIAFGQRKFGRYPFGDAGILVDSAPVGYALELQNRPFFPGYADTLTLVHELAHQWFGNSVTPRRWNHIWLSEGFASYAEWLWRAEHGGPPVRTIARKAFRAKHDWSPAPLRVRPATLFDDAVYTRGALTLQALRERVGRKVFFRIVRRWAAGHEYRNGTTAAFIRLAEKTSGRQLDKLFHDWLSVAKRPHGYFK